MLAGLLGWWAASSHKETATWPGLVQSSGPTCNISITTLPSQLGKPAVEVLKCWSVGASQRDFWQSSPSITKRDGETGEMTGEWEWADWPRNCAVCLINQISRALRHTRHSTQEISVSSAAYLIPAASYLLPHTSTHLKSRHGLDIQTVDCCPLFTLIRDSDLTWPELAQLSQGLAWTCQEAELSGSWAEEEGGARWLVAQEIWRPAIKQISQSDVCRPGTETEITQIVSFIIEILIIMINYFTKYKN